jgi:hypothetical protein
MRVGGLTLCGKGGGKPPHSKVGWGGRRFNGVPKSWWFENREATARVWRSVIVGRAVTKPPALLRDEGWGTRNVEGGFVVLDWALQHG